MQGKRKSPFVGSTVPLNNDTDPILYRRYTDLTDIVAGGENPSHEDAHPSSDHKTSEKKDKKRRSKAVEQAAAVAATPEVQAQIAELMAEAETDAPPTKKQRKKERWTDEQKEAARVAKGLDPKKVRGAAKEGEEGAAVGDASAADKKAKAKEEKKKKKEEKLKLRQLKPEERVSGPSNADEAEQIRGVLGWTKPDAPTRATFGFGFVPGATQPQLAPLTAVNGGKASDSSSSESDSDSDSEEEKQQQQGVKAAAVSDSSSDDDSSDEEAEEAKKESSSDSDSSSSESDSENESSSDSDSDSDSETTTTSSSSDGEDEEEKPPAAAAAAPAAPQQHQPVGGATAHAAIDSEFVPRRVYVGGMPYSYTEGQVHEYWSFCGEIESLDLLTFPDTGRFRGIAFITYTTEEGYQAALACDGENCDGQTLKVQKCKWSAKDRAAAQRAAQGNAGAPPTSAAPVAAPPATAPSQPQYFPPPSADQLAAPPVGHVEAPKKVFVAPAPKVSGYNVAYVGNLAYEADEAAVKALFEPYNVTKVRIHTDKDTGKPKGFAHVHVADEGSLDRAMELDGTNLLGRRIRVGYAQLKKGQQ